MVVYVVAVFHKEWGWEHHLVARVERADRLIRLCRDRLEAATLKVQRVVDALDRA